MRIFVAGATGAVGRRAVPLLVATGHSVTGIARNEVKRRQLTDQGAHGVEVDIFNPDGLRKAVAGHDAVINLATHIPTGSRTMLPWAWSENGRIRREGSANLVNAALATGASLFIQESFAPVYPNRGDEWIDESVPIKPARYNRPIVDAEESAARFATQGGRSIVLRFAFFYGADSGFLHDMIKSVRRGRAPAFNPEGFLSSVSHDDAASAVVAVLDAPSGTYNVVDDEPVRRREMFDIMARELGVQSPRFLPKIVARLMGSLGETLSRSQRISNAKIRGTTDWRPRYSSVREGLPEAIRQIR
ncbi:MAG TPA: NAD(P)-dependent oxidoreductase [Gemmatimonadaceae bacterium]|nr:NAD(P)-dependent oxidoreductase [Gemmatimonadaceae bacterium]